MKPRYVSVLRVLKSLHKYFRKLLENILLLLMIALAAVVVAGVVFRKAGASLVWYDEVASILLVWLTYYGAALVALDRAHIGFPNLMKLVSPRFRLPLLVLREAVVIGFFLIMTWAGWRVLLVLEGNYLVGLPWVPTRFTQSVIPIGAVLFIVAELLSLQGKAPSTAPAAEESPQ